MLLFFSKFLLSYIILLNNNNNNKCNGKSSNYQFRSLLLEWHKQNLVNLEYKPSNVFLEYDVFWSSHTFETATKIHLHEKSRKNVWPERNSLCHFLRLIKEPKMTLCSCIWDTLLFKWYQQYYFRKMSYES